MKNAMRDSRKWPSPMGEEFAGQPELSVTIATCNRTEEVCRCVLSLALLSPVSFEVIVLDDGSDEPIEPILMRQVPAGFPASIEVVRRPKPLGTISARNELASVARAPYLLSLDDDAYLLASDGILAALRALAEDERLGSIAFPQRDAQGSLRDGQPAKADYVCYCPTFYGYATLIRRDALLQVGGYRDLWYQEEAECAKRLANAGYLCIYWPEAQVAHVPSPRNRKSAFSEFRAKCQLWNRCQDAIYNEPLPLMVYTLVATIFRAMRAKSTWHLPPEAEIGPVWLLKEIRRAFPDLWRMRRPLRYRVFFRWRWVRWKAPAYSPIEP